MKHLTVVGRYGTLGLEFAITFCLGLFGGQWLDRKYGTTYWIWIGMVVGAYAGFRAIWKAAKDAQRAIEREDREEPGKFRPVASEDGEMDEGYDATSWKDDERRDDAEADGTTPLKKDP